MCVNNLPKVATHWNSGATRDSNHSRRVLIPGALTTRAPSHTAATASYLLGRCCGQVFLQSNRLPLSDDIAVKLRSHIDNIVTSLPADLQSVLTWTYLLTFHRWWRHFRLSASHVTAWHGVIQPSVDLRAGATKCLHRAEAYFIVSVIRQ